MSSFLFLDDMLVGILDESWSGLVREVSVQARMLYVSSNFGEPGAK